MLDLVWIAIYFILICEYVLITKSEIFLMKVKMWPSHLIYEK